MKKIFLKISLLLALGLKLVANEAILAIDNGGHTDQIWDVITTKNGDIITASADKSIRVWDSKTGKEKRKILGVVRNGGIGGVIYAIALSPDERYLAVGGITPDADIRLYDYASGKLIKLLHGHSDTTFDLSFSADGRYLLSGSYDKSAIIWDMKKPDTPMTQVQYHTEVVYAVKLATFNAKTVAITASYDNRIAIHDLQGNLLNSYTYSDKLQYLTANSNEIAACGFSMNEILIFDTNLRLKNKIKTESYPTGLAYSPNGKYLISGYIGSPDIVTIYDAKNEYTKISTFNKHNNLTKAVNFLDNHTAISAGGDNFAIYAWDIHNPEKIITSIEGKGKTVWKVGIKNNSIAWGNKLSYKSNNDYGLLQKSFSLDTHTIQNISRKDKKESFNTIDTEGLTYVESGDYYGATLVLPNNKKITKDSSNGYRHNCAGWYGKYIISGGMNGSLKIFNQNGDDIAELLGHTGEIWSIALDGDRLVSGSSDQTIRIWDLASIKKGAKEIYPTISIFFDSNGEWVMWTPSGFFDASQNGAKYVGYHINKKFDEEADFITVDKLYKSFYRPDLVEKALQGENLDLYAKEINIEKILHSGLAPIVSIKTLSGESEKRDIELTLEVCEKDGGYNNPTLYLNGMAINILDKNRAIKANIAKNIFQKCTNFSPMISLTSGINTIGFKATNEDGLIESNLDQITINYGEKNTHIPHLHVFSIGIDKYRDGDLHLKYSVADAKAIAKTLQKNGEKLFEKIHIYELFDKDVTKEKILEKFAEIGAKTTREDVFIFYMAGHGITDAKTGAYFYLPVDFRYINDDSVRVSGVGQEDFTQALSKIQALKSVTLIDTCNSGSFAEALASRGVLQKTAIDKLTRATGRATLVASSKDQVALEGYEGHGVFTYTMIEALNGKAVNNGKVTLKSMATYIEDILPERTYQKWGYEQVPQSHITGTDFPLGLFESD